MSSQGGRLAAKSAVLAASLLLAGEAAAPIGPIPLDAHLKGMWSPVAPWPVIGIHAVLLPEGRVLTYGTDTNGRQTGFFTYDVWDPAAGLDGGHLTLPNGTGTDIFCNSQLVLPHSGAGVLLAGGDNWNGTSTTNTGNNNSAIFDPSTNSLARGNNMNRARWYSTAITLPNGETYIQGGKDGGADRPEIRSASGAFRLLSNADTSALDYWYPRNFVAPDGRVFGYDTAGGIMYYIDPSGLGNFTTVGQLPAASRGREGSAAMFQPGRILHYGASSGAIVIDITGGTPVVTPTQSMSKQRRWSTATLLANGQVLATGGSVVYNAIDNTLPDGGVSYEAEIWNPSTGTWTLGARAARMRLYHSTALLLPDATVLVAGGGAPGPQTNLNAEIYYPPYLFGANGTLASRPAITWAPELLQLGESFTVDVDAAAGISRVTLVKTGSVTHSWNMEQRFLELVSSATGSASLSVQAPASFNDAPPGMYLLFVIDNAGVPSLARIVRIEPAPGTNQAPTVNAGADMAVTLPNSANLTGSASDDGLPNPPAALTISWTKVSGPGTVTFSAPTSLTTTASFSAAGSYVLRLTVSDGALTASDDVSVTVNPVSDRAFKLPASGATLSGTMPYGGLEVVGSNITQVWFLLDGTRVSGPEGGAPWQGTVGDTTRFTNGAHQVQADITGTNGVVERIAIPVTIANGVSDRAFKFPASGATLSGVVAYGGLEVVGSNIAQVKFLLDGQQISTIENTAPWQGGFDTTTFSNGAHSLQADITGTNGVVERIAIPVTISNTGPAPTNQAPVVNAGSDLTVTLPNSANLTGSATDDALPNPPAAMTISWTKVSGPGTVTFGNAASAQTTASFSASGAYVLRLTASDSVLTASDDVGVTVNPAAPTNQAPVVNAGSDLTVTLPNSANLTGSATDDALPNPPAALTISWSKVSGPGTVTFGNAASAQTTASFSASGAYVLRLTASDSALTTSDDVSVTVNPAAPTNQAPVVNAGSDLTVTLPNSANLTGSATDDALPNPPAAMTISWSKVSGPGTVTFGNAASAQTTASFSASGAYVLRLTASDSALTTSDDVSVTVNPAAPTNQAPVVNAGSDLTVTLPNSANLTGSATDDALPNPPAAMTISWTKVSGPGTVTFGNAASAQTTASFSASGAYVLRLTASDSVLTASDDVGVTVNPAAPTNQAPVVNAGSDLTVTLPNSANLTGSATDDALPNPPAALTISWSKVSGPGTVTFGNAASAQTTASFSASGAYVLRLTASDSVLTASDDVSVTVNPAAPTNQAPVVNAGPDMAVTLPNSVLLQGGATDDGLPNPPATLTYSWTKVSGSGSVTFGTPTAPTTTASFSTNAKGTFVLRLTASDGALTASDEVSVAVTPCVKVKGKCQ